MLRVRPWQARGSDTFAHADGAVHPQQRDVVAQAHVIVVRMVDDLRDVEDDSLGGRTDHVVDCGPEDHLILFREGRSETHPELSPCHSCCVYSGICIMGRYK